MNPLHLLLTVGTIVLMEAAVTLFHRYVMHGFGWRWHKSHHHPERNAVWETNDWYAVVFSAATVFLFVIGGSHAPVWWIALGITVYGLLYGIVHDVLVHRRIPVRWQPKNAYLRHLISAHRLHHAVRSRDGAVSFGFLYAPPLEALRGSLRERRPSP